MTSAAEPPSPTKGSKKISIDSIDNIDALYEVKDQAGGSKAALVHKLQGMENQLKKLEMVGKLNETTERLVMKFARAE